MHLDPQESITALCAHQDDIAALVVQAGVGAVAHFHAGHWLAVEEAAVVEGDLVGASSRDGIDYVMDARGALSTVQKGAVERRPWDPRMPALRSDDGSIRVARGLLVNPAHDKFYPVDGGLVVHLHSAAEPVFYASAASGMARVAEIGVTAPLRQGPFVDDSAPDHAFALIVDGGVWVWRDGALDAVDLTAW
jgi:hypothetical protein